MRIRAVQLQTWFLSEDKQEAISDGRRAFQGYQWLFLCSWRLTPVCSFGCSLGIGPVTCLFIKKKNKNKIVGVLGGGFFFLLADTWFLHGNLWFYANVNPQHSRYIKSPHTHIIWHPVFEMWVNASGPFSVPVKSSIVASFKKGFCFFKCHVITWKLHLFLDISATRQS